MDGSRDRGRGDDDCVVSNSCVGIEIFSIRPRDFKIVEAITFLSISQSASNMVEGKRRLFVVDLKGFQ
jgi:hypothetical protein